MILSETAYAKLNLALHVRAREPDGYHRIETVFAFCTDGDGLAVERSEDLTLSISGPFGDALDPAENLVLRAAEALRGHYGVSAGAHLHLDKRLPVAAGIGGGSADAAAVLRLLVRWWALPKAPDVLQEIAGALGADVPACIASRTVRGEGRGDDLRPVTHDPGGLTHVLLVNPRVPVPTGPVFAGWDGVDRGPLGSEQMTGRNDLLASALGIAPVIGDVLAALAEADLCGMSGSGATCFGLFPNTNQLRAVSAQIAKAHPHWWRLETGLR